MSILNIVVNQMKFIAVTDENAIYVRWTKKPANWLTDGMCAQKYSIELNRT